MRIVYCGSDEDIFRWRTGFIYRTWGRSFQALTYIQSCWLYFWNWFSLTWSHSSLRVNKTPRRILCNFINTGCLDDPGWLSQYLTWLWIWFLWNSGLVSFTTVTKRFFCYRVEWRSGADADPLRSCILALLRCWLKQPACEAGQSPLSCSEFQNTWIFTSTPHLP